MHALGSLVFLTYTHRTLLLNLKIT
ncbi:hypothetical protein XFF6166_880033 [Xanthomonas citri pv. fuscans]|nr:hypothetical protein XFF6166_880033 [Xanthomonas citri pv. fuscans]SOO04387.1 hypothetical protein XFF6960_970033 [Xanthomonas citri pv. fuscans]SOO07489.1 hypothetical protein XFF7767_970065 [Xanthomonas citri pv. fuscans]SOO08086.1 hypothetical protein XFF6970_150029 [Xanthomonas citri pv. fuscans]SOO13453.1 hypothetical protein XFF7766_180026 [Xanthomonas citri pv. fuscans]